MKILIWIAGLTVFVLSFAAAMIFGAADISARDVWLAIATNAPGEQITIIREIRLPREIAAIFVGAALAVSGAIMQGMTRNPLADPGLMGLTAGAKAALAATLAWVPSADYYALMIACFVGAAAGALMVFGLGAWKKGGLSPFRLVLAGAAISAFLYALADGIGIAGGISQEVSLWTSGGLIGTAWDQLRIIAPVIGAGILVAVLFSRQLTVLSLSEDVSIVLGQRTNLVRTVLFLTNILLAGASVALAGNLAFIGLMIPHLVRAAVGTDYRNVIPMSVLAGASFMLLADTLGRTIGAPYETPVAAIAAVLGLPFFLFVVRKGGRAFA